MNDRTESKRRQTSPTCQHRWLLDTPGGPEVQGRCRTCGRLRSFPTVAEEVRARPFGLREQSETRTGAYVPFGADAA